MDFFLDDDQEVEGGGGGLGGEGGDGQGGGGEGQGGVQEGEGGDGQGGGDGGDQGGGDGDGQGGEGGGQGGEGGDGQGGGDGGGQGGGDGVDHGDLIDRIEQIVEALERATVYIVGGQYWVTNGVQTIGNLPELAVRPNRALQAIQECQFRFELSLGQIQLAINAIQPMLQLPVIEPFPEVIATVAEAHDVINAALVGLHGNLLVLVKAQAHTDSQARIQMGLSLLHIACRQCQDAITTFEFLHDGHDWDWGEADVQQQA